MLDKLSENLMEPMQKDNLSESRFFRFHHERQKGTIRLTVYRTLEVCSIVLRLHHHVADVEVQVPWTK